MSSYDTAVYVFEADSSWSPIEGGMLDFWNAEEPTTMSGKKRKARKAKRKARKAKKKAKRKERKVKRKAKKKARKAKRKAKRKARRQRRQIRKMERRARKKGGGAGGRASQEIIDLADSYADAPDTSPVPASTAQSSNTPLIIGGVLAVAAAGAYWYMNR